jgi:L-ascorbate metabolism protein UlaG (beta-lactamase superfamily)
MRLRRGRPDLAPYDALFSVPTARAGSTLRVTFLGVSTLHVTDGVTSLLTDGYFSRLGLVHLAARRIAPNPSRIDTALRHAGIDRLDAVLPVHTHFDHVLDSAVVAERTGAVLVGGTSVANVARGSGLPRERTVLVTPGEPLQLGAFSVTHIVSEHCPPDRYPGTIDSPVKPPARASAYRCGEAWSIVVRHAGRPVTSDGSTSPAPGRPEPARSLLIQGSAGFRHGALAGHTADVAYLGVGQLGLQTWSYIRDYWQQTVRTVGARRVVLIHWDDFFRPLDEPLRALPYAGDDLDVTLRLFQRLAERDGVELLMPRVWVPEDPWSQLR